MADDQSPQPLDYQPRSAPRRRWRPRPWVLLAALLCFVLAWVSLAQMRDRGTFFLPLPDPPPRGDPYWHERANDQWWFLVGCCATPALAFVGLCLLIAGLTWHRN